MAHRSKPTIFLTGASGILGGALLEALTDYEVIALVHRTPVLAPHVTCVRGDISSPRFGLDAMAYQELTRRVDWIIHTAAITSFTESADRTFHTNLRGTESVLELAADARAPLYHVSTAFVHPGKYAEGSLPATAYEESKRQAEQVIRASGLPATILRPSIIVGDSRTGAIASFQGFHTIAGLLLTGKLPIILGVPDSPVDMIPLDYVARSIAALLERGVVGGEFFLSSGGDAPRLRLLIELLVAESGRLIRRELARPRIIRPRYFEQSLTSELLDARSTGSQRLLAQCLMLSRYISLEEPLPSSLPELRASHGLPPLPDMGRVFIKNLEYWVASNPRRLSSEEGPEEELPRARVQEEGT